MTPEETAMGSGNVPYDELPFSVPGRFPEI
jgi:hypothetical protein